MSPSTSSLKRPTTAIRLLLHQKGKHEKVSKAPQNAERLWQITPVPLVWVPLLLCKRRRGSVCLCANLPLLFHLGGGWVVGGSGGGFGRLAGVSGGRQASEWHNRKFSRWPFTQSVLAHAPATRKVLTFTRSLLNTLQLLPRSICVCIPSRVPSNDFPVLLPRRVLWISEWLVTPDTFWRVSHVLVFVGRRGGNW